MVCHDICKDIESPVCLDFYRALGVNTARKGETVNKKILDHVLYRLRNSIK